MALSVALSFENALNKCERHSCSSWHRELEIVKALKIAYDDQNRDKEAIALKKLGDVYYNRGCVVDDSMSLFSRLDQYVVATALYNASLLRNNDESKRKEVKKKLLQIEDDIISLCDRADDKGNDFKYDVDRVEDHKKLLNDFRNDCREKLNTIQKTYAIFTSPLHDRDTQMEAKRAEEIRELFAEIREFVRDCFNSLIEECVKVIGEPPGEIGFAFIAFGSFARCEVTPYSDLEFALLVDEGTNNAPVKQYFVKLLEYFTYKVINLRETILPTMCIPSLNDKNNALTSTLSKFKCSSLSCDNHVEKVDAVEWPFPKGKEFYDDEMRGFSLDGRMSQACKTPLGSIVQGRGKNKDLIKTPKELADLYIKSLKDDQGANLENNYHLSSVLSNIYFLYGKKELVDMFSDSVQSKSDISDDIKTLNPRKSSASECLKNAFEQFHYSLTSRDFGMISSIKKKLYRSVGMLISNIGKFQHKSVVNKTPWSILDRLRDEDIISNDVHHNLFVVVSIVNELRLMAYLRCGRQDEIFSFFDQSVDINLDVVRDLCIRFFYTVLPFQKAVKMFMLNLRDQTVQQPLKSSFNVKFYEYSHFNSAIALAFTSYRYFNEMSDKFVQAYNDSQSEELQRVCLAYLSCLNPDYSSRYTRIILNSINDGNNSQWKILSCLIAAMASFHQDDVEQVRTFLNTAKEASESTVHDPDSVTQVTTCSYQMFISGLLDYRQRSYNEALVKFLAAQVLYESVMQSKDDVVKSLFENSALFMIGSCRVMLGSYDDPCLEKAMLNARHYTGNGDFMRILYHAYILLINGMQNEERVIQQFEKIIELFLRFRCPKGNEIWASILSQSIIVAAITLGILYRNKEQINDAIRIFRLASSRLIPKAIEHCSDKHHVGKINAEKARSYIQAFRGVFKFAEAECLHARNSKDEMWSCISEGLATFADFRGFFDQIEQKDVLAESFSLDRFHLRGRQGHLVWRSMDNRPHAAPRFIDTFTMAPLLQIWCDSLTRELQYILYTTERDLTNQVLQLGAPIISIFSSQNSSQLLEQFQVNPCRVLGNFIPFLRPFADGFIGNIFITMSSERSAIIELIKTTLFDVQPHAMEFIDYWKELFILCIRFSLCNDLLKCFGFLNE